jgi:Zn-dependent metalloprotease
MDNRLRPGRCGCCSIVPPAVLRALARDPDLSENLRAIFERTYAETQRLRVIRDGVRRALAQDRNSMRELDRRMTFTAGAAEAVQRLFDCEHRRSLPGRPVDPKTSKDEAIKVVWQVTGKVAEFYAKVLHRNSIDNDGLDLVSSVHYLEHYDNAFWNGQQMVYGDGDGKVFAEFWRSADVIGHELTHGVTQYESGLLYEGEPGALNESVSDVFGAAFNQWLNKWPAGEPKGWLIGAGIMGSQSKAAGRTCLRDMADPGASHCLSPQPASYKDFDATADVHENSGIPNKAFSTFAQALGGNAWETPIAIWYDACTSGRLSGSATFVEFANLTIETAAAHPNGATLKRQLQSAWQAVDLPLGVA